MFVICDLSTLYFWEVSSIYDVNVLLNTIFIIFLKTGALCLTLTHICHALETIHMNVFFEIFIHFKIDYLAEYPKWMANSSRMQNIMLFKVGK